MISFLTSFFLLPYNIYYSIYLWFFGFIGFFFNFSNLFDFFVCVDFHFSLLYFTVLLYKTDNLCAFNLFEGNPSWALVIYFLFGLVCWFYWFIDHIFLEFFSFKQGLHHFKEREDYLSMTQDSSLYVTRSFWQHFNQQNQRENQ